MQHQRRASQHLVGVLPPFAKVTEIETRHVVIYQPTVSFLWEDKQKARVAHRMRTAFENIHFGQKGKKSFAVSCLSDDDADYGDDEASEYGSNNSHEDDEKVREDVLGSTLLSAEEQTIQDKQIGSEFTDGPSTGPSFLNNVEPEQTKENHGSECHKARGRVVYAPVVREDSAEPSIRIEDIVLVSPRRFRELFGKLE